VSFADPMETAAIERAMWEQHLALAERHIAEGEGTVTHQRRIVADLEREGHDSAKARALLHQFQQLLDLHVVDRDRIRQQLGLAQQE